MQNAIMRTITDKLFLFLLVFLVLCMTDMSYAQTVTDDGKGICKTLDNLEKILTGISVVVVTLAVMWAGYKFLFTRAEVAECGKILAAGVMIGSASTIAGWFMGKNKTCEDALQGIGVDAN